MTPTRSVAGCIFQVERNRDMNTLKPNGTGFIFTSPSGHYVKMHEKDGVIMVGYKAAATWDEEAVSNQTHARDLFERVMKQVPIEV